MVILITIAGDIILKVPTSLESKLDLKADLVSVDEQLDMTSRICMKSGSQEQVTGIVRHVCFNDLLPSEPRLATSPRLSFHTCSI